MAESIGIVAFSEAQQDEIEGALQRLAQEDAAFRDLLDAEWEREVDGQFVGLLVKNLENIQGDERDIVVLSVCYGYGPNGKMLMNFGPINKSGGERRLNVAFSRAKHHMAVVSSIQFTDITNDYNDGANCLKNYLRYAEAVSIGNGDVTQRILHGMSRWPAAAEDQDGQPDPVAEQIAAALTDRGFVVDRAVGQSHFRCDLAVRRDGDTAYRLAILLDNDGYYDQSDLLERDLMRPKLLRDFGWRVAFVLAKDWYEDRAAVLDRLTRLLAGDEEPEEDEADEADEENLEAEQDAEQFQAEAVELKVDPPVQPAAESEATVEASETPLVAARTGQDSATILTTPIEATVAESSTRRFEVASGNSNKFWEITLAGVQHTVRFGRIGSKGQSVTKTFEDSRIGPARLRTIDPQQEGKRVSRDPVTRGCRPTYRQDCQPIAAATSVSSLRSSMEATAVISALPNWPNRDDGLSYSRQVSPSSFSQRSIRSGAYRLARMSCCVIWKAISGLPTTYWTAFRFWPASRSSDPWSIVPNSINPLGPAIASILALAASASALAASESTTF